MFAHLIANRPTLKSIFNAYSKLRIETTIIYRNSKYTAEAQAENSHNKQNKPIFFQQMNKQNSDRSRE